MVHNNPVNSSPFFSRFRTIILSVISLLNEPNISSPANVDASVAYRKWRSGEDMTYETRIRAEVKASKKLAEDEGLNIPMTMDEYLKSSISTK
jgi:ubiquitin-conjugating enzyme E2 R